MENKQYIHPTEEAGKAFFIKQMGAEKPEVVMLNLLKFKSKADYSTSPELAPSSEISGKEAYRRYMEHTMPFLEEAGSEVMFLGKGGTFLIGPDIEGWDAVMLVRHASAAKFVAFAQNEAYLKGMGHRTAALEDSRLLPVEEGSFV